jgi:transcription elongation factor Elf1
MEKKLPGNIYIEILLWLLIIVPGIIYTTWRWTGKRTYICPKCYNDKVVENSHPDAIALRQRKSLVKCKYCAEEIKPDAKMCKHCGRDVEPDAVQQSSDFRMNID